MTRKTLIYSLCAKCGRRRINNGTTCPFTDTPPSPGHLWVWTARRPGRRRITADTFTNLIQAIARQSHN